MDMRKVGGDARPLFYSFRLYLNSNGARVLGKGGALILEAIDKRGSIALAAEELKMSYRFVWNSIQRTEDRLGKPVVVTRRGGTPNSRRKGGGSTKLTPVGRALLRDYRIMEERLQSQIRPRSRSLAHTQ